jgi:uncharacterized protein (DUF2237 family)
MRIELAAYAALTSLMLASCGRLDASGIYVLPSDREVTLVQLVETKDGTLTGRLENVRVDAAGVVHDKSVNLDGAASGHDLMFKPTSAWFGGLNATGSFDRGGLTLTGAGLSLKADRSSLEKYQAAVAHLRSLATTDRQSIAAARAQEAAQAAQAQAETEAAKRVSALEAASVELRSDTAKLDSAIAAAPDFGQRAAANTVEISKMMSVAPTLNGIERNRLMVSANQVVVGTNQIEVARSQYALGLSQIAQRGGPLADQVLQFCGSPRGVQFTQPCSGAMAAASDFKKSMMHGVSSFGGHKQTVQTELSRQSELIRRMGG